MVEDNRQGDVPPPLGADAIAPGHWRVAGRLGLGFGILIALSAPADACAETLRIGGRQ